MKRQILTGSFEPQEIKGRSLRESIKYFPNLLTYSRAVGGIALGSAMAVEYPSSGVAALSAVGLAMTDGEGTFINFFKNKAPKLRQKLGILPTEFGRVYDPVADKVFGISVLAGGLYGGYLPSVTGAIVATELATTTATFYANHKTGDVPNVSRVGKAGLITRFSAIGGYLTAGAVGNETVSSVFENTGHVSTAVAVVLGTASCYDVMKQARPQLAEG